MKPAQLAAIVGAAVFAGITAFSNLYIGAAAGASVFVGLLAVLSHDDERQDE